MSRVGRGSREDLFWADLLRAPRRARSAPDDDLFWADLMGEAPKRALDRQGPVGMRIAHFVQPDEWDASSEAWFQAPRSRTPGTYDVVSPQDVAARNLVPNSVWRATIPLGSSATIDFVDGEGLTVTSNNPSVIRNPIPETTNGNIRTFTLVSAGIGTTMLEVSTAPGRGSLPLQVRVTAPVSAPAPTRASAGRRGNFPPRPAGAMGGRAFMKTIAGEGTPSDWSAREDALVEQLATGNMPGALRRWVKIELSVTRAGKTITGSVEVLPDYLCIGSDSDFIHAPLDPVSAQKVADRLDMNLATAKICHAIYLATAAANRIGMIARDYYNPDSARRTAPPRLAQDSTAAYVEHSERIQEKMAAGGIKLGTLVAGHKKDVVVSARLLKNQNKIAFHGFYDDAGYPMEPCYENKNHRPDPSCNRELPALAHLRRFSDYSQGVRLVRDLMIVDGAPRSMREVLVHPELSWLISAEGPIDPPRIPSVPVSRAQSREPAEDVSSAPRATTVTIEAATGLGTARTTAPIAVVSPHRQMNELLDRELILFAKARIVAEWLDRRLSTTFEEAFRDAALVARLDLSKDRGLLGRLRPFPGFAIPDRRGQLFTTDALLDELRRPPGDAYALWPIFDVLHYHGVVLLPPNRADPFGNPGVLANITRTEARLSRARFDTQSAAIEAFARTFKTNVAAGDLARVVETGTIDASLSSAKASDALIYRTFASSVLTLVSRLRALNTTWVAGTYRRHWWNEFSIDAFIRTGRDDRGFYTRAAVRSFFEALNAACEDSAAPGKFAWKAIYNDEGLAREMDGLYGAGRVLFGVDGHGPGPRMHIHLDVRPLVVTLDSTTGFRMDGNRVVLVSPPHDAVRAV